MFKIVNAPWEKGSIYVEGYPTGEISSSFLWEEPSVEGEVDFGAILSAFFGEKPESLEKDTKTQGENNKYDPGKDKIKELAETLAEYIYDGRVPPREGDIPFGEYPREEGRYTPHDDIDGELMEVRAYPGEDELGTLELPWASFPVYSYYEIETVANVIEKYPPPNLEV